jgi:acyl carrier protein
LLSKALLDVADVSLTATLEELGIDSLGVVESIFAIEEEFDIEVPFNANAPQESEFDISSVATIISAVETLVAEQT